MTFTQVAFSKLHYKVSFDETYISKTFLSPLFPPARSEQNSYLVAMFLPLPRHVLQKC